VQLLCKSIPELILILEPNLVSLAKEKKENAAATMEMTSSYL
jgi:hypothetical protein